VKRAVGDDVMVEADVFTDGHDAVVAELLWRRVGASEWQVVPMAFLGNDHWSASFRVEKLGRYEYTVRGWTDPFVTWQRDLRKRQEAGQDLSIDFLIGGALSCNPILKDAARTAEERYQTAIHLRPPPADPSRVLQYERALQVVVDPVHARFSSWYELFPRSVRGDGKHASFRDLIAFLPEVEAMGFDVLYLPPVHPIGMTERKGKNNALKAEPSDVGSPWAIGANEGGHKALHPQLGTFGDFDALVHAAGEGHSERSTSPSSARPTTRTCASIRNGFAPGRMAPSSTPRTRRRNTRTSIHSISNRAIGAGCGPS